MAGGSDDRDRGAAGRGGLRMRTSKKIHVADTANSTKIAVTLPAPVPGPGPDLGLVPGSRPRFAGAGNRGWPGRFPICRESGTGPRPDSHRGVCSLGLPPIAGYQHFHK